ncbi:sigma-54-dependent Fis family transcriptional regulator [Natroniella sulfidigena]|uniref:sigma-54 interaction domain-containing protein n=1 Tax=Natroniella sulfidigena TaxID=723921 RepID=UPI00200B12E1|nr:sigma-54-dependent Fis family transcriptional regulator [Natroniella sulfidigena]MCK8817652.1 sigma-54-dependent Fis family transcriptional regulator [Natroniella sulfidigena]
MTLEKFTQGTKEELSNWFEAIVDSVYNGIVAIDNKQQVIFFNRASEKLLGIKKEEALGQKVMEVIPETGLVNVLQTGLKETGQQLKVNGREIYSNRTPIIYDDKVIGAIAVFQDITEIVETKQKLEETENDLEILETILDNAYEGIIIVDRDGYITKFNKAYQNFLGLKEEEVLGEHVTDVIENTRMHIAVKTGEAEEDHVQRIQGHDMIASRIPIKKDGQVIGAIGKVLFQDVKELESLAHRTGSLKDRFDYYKNEIKRMQEAKYSFDNIITQNKQMKYLKKIAMKAAESSSTVLIQGESGTGKELFAHAIHKASYRKYGAFIRVNCAAIPESLLEAELFGYEKGAFTGAKKQGKPGKFELANGGTIFLDEIGTMPTEMQAKLLRVLQEREVERIGGTTTIDLDVRVIAATNEKLGEEVKEGNFRQDLFYRLNVIRLQIPPLRERLDDIPILANAILKELVKELQLGPKELAPQTINSLRNYSWPGNVRELHNFIERAINISPEKMILPEHLPEVIRPSDKSIMARDSWNLKQIVAEAETRAIKQALKQTDGNRTAAAELLGIHRTSLYKKIDRYQIDMSKV